MGGITNPLTVIEQITYLMYSRMLDTQEQRDEKRKQIAGIDFKPRFAPEQQEFRFSHYSNLGSDEMMEVVRDGVFQHFRQLGQADASKVTLLGNFMKDARLEIVNNLSMNRFQRAVLLQQIFIAGCQKTTGATGWIANRLAAGRVRLHHFNHRADNVARRAELTVDSGSGQLIDSTLSAMVKTKKTELLFLARILQMLKVGGRSATIVPQGVLFGSSKAHQSLRKTLVEDNQLEAVINLPSGVFKPYAGVATAILIFTKGGQTDEVWFYDLQNDGYSLDDKRNPIKDNDLPHLLASWKHYRTLRGLPVDNFMGEKLGSLLKQQYPEGIDAGVDFKDRTQAAFVVPKADIAAQKYDLSINRYKEVVYQAEEYEDPKVILKRLKDLEKEILADLDELEGMLLQNPRQEQQFSFFGFHHCRQRGVDIFLVQ